LPLRTHRRKREGISVREKNEKILNVMRIRNVDAHSRLFSKSSKCRKGKIEKKIDLERKEQNIHMLSH